MSLFAYLLLAHLVLDYPLQGDFLANQKKNHVLLLAAHAAMWGLGVSAVLDHLGRLSPWMVWWLVLGHWVVDWLKCHRMQRWFCGCEGEAVCELLGHRENGRSRWATDPLGLPLWVDQTLHLLQLWAVCQ